MFHSPGGSLGAPEYRCIYTYIKGGGTMASRPNNPGGCNCLALRQAARHVTQFYDTLLAPTGLRTTQYSILARLNRRGPMTVNALAAALVMDRTTLARNMLPLERDGLVAIGPGKRDRRSKELRLTRSGTVRFRTALKAWTRAQAKFEETFGLDRSRKLRSLLDEVAASDLK